MSNQFNKSFFAFMARFAIICNVSFLFATMFVLFSWFKLPHFLASFFAVLGVLSPVVNLCIIFWLIGSLIARKRILLPKWQTIFILLMLSVQIASRLI
jgi:hypothetical protein